VFAIDPKEGKLFGQKHIGDRFGIVNPVIVGGIIYLGNSWDWLIAVYLSEFPNMNKVLMSLKSGEEIGAEIHSSID